MSYKKGVNNKEKSDQKEYDKMLGYIDGIKKLLCEPELQNDGALSGRNKDKVFYSKLNSLALRITDYLSFIKQYNPNRFEEDKKNLLWRVSILYGEVKRKKIEKEDFLYKVRLNHYAKHVETLVEHIKNIK